MDPNKSFPPPTLPVMPSQFFPPPPNAMFPATGFHVPPPNVVPLTPNFPISTFRMPPPNIASASSFNASNFRVPPKTTENDITSLESIIIARRNQRSNEEIEKNVPSIKVYEFSQLVEQFDRSLKKIGNMLEDLKSCSNDDDRDDVREKISAEEAHISKLKESMGIYLTNIRILKTKISKRKRKRRRKPNRTPSLTAHQIASDHMQQLQRAAIAVEQDERLKRDADNILSNVLRKKNEGANRIQLLEKLEKLHIARNHAMGVDARNSGFVNVIEKLKMMWEAQLKEYAVEENGFRTMLEESAVDRKKERNKKMEKILMEWFKVIFGVSDPQTPLFYSNVDEFIRIRHDWDKYIVQDCDISLKIPPGWVLPKEKCDNAWKKYIYR